MQAPAWLRPTPPILSRLAGVSLVLLGAAIPLSVAGVGLFTATTLLFGLLAGQYAGAWRTLPRHPVSVAALTLFGWLLLAALYAPVSAEEAFHALKKYRELLLIPLLLPLFAADPRYRRWGLHAFVAAMLITLVLSYGKGIALLLWAAEGEEIDAIVFKHRITQNTLMALVVFWMALQAMRAGPWRRLWVVLILLALGDMFLLVGGRTGHVVLLALAGLLLFHRYRWRGLAIAAVGGLTLIALLYTTSGVFKARLDEAQEGLAGYQAGEYHVSTAHRLSFYRNSLALIAERPLFGHGTGSFPRLYAAQVAGTTYPVTENPHNEYLLLAVQGGLVASALLLYLFGRHAWDSCRLAGEDRLMAQALVLTMALGCLLNSFLLDHTEGHLYAYLTALLFAPLLPQPPGREPAA